MSRGMWLGNGSTTGLGQTGEILHRVEGPGKATVCNARQTGVHARNQYE